MKNLQRLWLTSRRSLSQSHTNLFGLNITCPDDLSALAAKSIAESNQIRKLLKEENQQLSTAQILHLTDAISNNVCRVIDPSEFCRSVHQNPEYADAAQSTFESMSSYIHELNSDLSIFHMLKHIQQTATIWDTLNEEEKIFVTDMTAEYEAEELGEILAEIVQLEAKYIKNLTQFEETFLVGPVPGDQFGGLRRWLERYVDQSTGSAGMVVVNSDPAVLNALLGSVHDENCRRQAFAVKMCSPKENADVLCQLIFQRQLLGMGLGHQSYAHKFLKKMAAKTPDNVWSMLRSLSDSAREPAEKQLAVLRTLKQELMSNTGSGTVQPWDLPLLKAISAQRQATQQQQSSINGKPRFDVSKISEYFPLHAALEGLCLLCRELFGMALHIRPLSALESWALASSSGKEEATPLYRVDVHGPQREYLGVVYLDLFSRTGKFPGSAHFTLQTGCRLQDNKGRLLDGHQTPIVGLVLNLRPNNVGKNSWNSWFSAKSATVDLPTDNWDPKESVVGISSDDCAHTTLLSLTEVETLHHEWGHVLHSLLSRTRFQHLSGTRTAIDFAEVPSHLFEYFSRAPSVLAQWGRHYKSADRLPIDLAEEALRGKNSNAALELQHQILYSAADQFLFGENVASLCEQLRGVSDISTRHDRLFSEVCNGLSQQQKELTCLPLDSFSLSNENTSSRRFAPSTVPTSCMPLLSHGHFVNYGAGYYSYLFARLHAAQIWHLRFSDKPLSRSSGDLLWHGFLQFGASKDPLSILTDLSGGRNLDPSWFLRDSGLL